MAGLGPQGIVCMFEFPKPPLRIETERLVLKARAEDQAEEMFALIDQNRAYLRPWMPWEATTRTVEDSRIYLAMARSWRESGRNFDYSCFEKSSGRMTGSFGLHSIDWENQSCHLGFWIAEEFQGQGLVSEAIRAGETLAATLGFHRLILTCDGRNLKSAAVARRNAYLPEAKMIDECVDRGRHRDTLWFAKLLNPKRPGYVTENLPLGYMIKNCESEEFWRTVEEPMVRVFEDNELIVRPRDLYSEFEKDQLKQLNENFRHPFVQHSLVLKDGDLAGWTWGYQDSRDSYYMVNSAVLPEHRGRGLYSRLLDVSLEELLAKGFQRVWSRHNMTNSAILVPKLKKGFVLTGTELNDFFGTLVHLTYFANSTRRKALDFRSGLSRPDEELKKVFRL